MNRNNPKLSVGYLLLQGMATMYNQSAYQQDLVYEFWFNDTSERFQLQFFRTKCVVATDNFLNFTVRIESKLDTLQQLSDSLAADSTDWSSIDCNIEGDRAALKILPELLSMDVAAKVENSINPAKSQVFILHAPIIALWLGAIITDFWGGILVVLTAISAIKIFVKDKYSILNYATVAIGVIAGLLCIMNGYAVYIIPAAYILLGIIWCASTFTEYPMLAEYMAEVFDLSTLSPAKSKKICSYISGGWGILFVLFGIFIGIYQSESNTNELIVYAVVFSGLLWLITRYVMNTFFSCKLRNNASN